MNNVYKTCTTTNMLYALVSTIKCIKVISQTSVIYEYIQCGPSTRTPFYVK